MTYPQQPGRPGWHGHQAYPGQGQQGWQGHQAHPGQGHQPQPGPGQAQPAPGNQPDPRQIRPTHQQPYGAQYTDPFQNPGATIGGVDSGPARRPGRTFAVIVVALGLLAWFLADDRDDSDADAGSTTDTTAETTTPPANHEPPTGEPDDPQSLGEHFAYAVNTGDRDAAYELACPLGEPRVVRDMDRVLDAELTLEISDAGDSGSVELTLPEADEGYTSSVSLLTSLNDPGGRDACIVSVMAFSGEFGELAEPRDGIEPNPAQRQAIDESVGHVNAGRSAEVTGLLCPSAENERRVGELIDSGADLEVDYASYEEWATRPGGTAELTDHNAAPGRVGPLRVWVSGQDEGDLCVRLSTP
ncbi:hypothetical protein BJF85_08065 [Saccharomonospora sp. CUA-673]|uniref:hypothetical protein n=1 Tax=Saccharomonospora sp. CUA-673 TaxID=1904969 RepID=UPI00095BCD32|nr:hypothetical protein [Saccharomonospora sp. CUA-673]OLT38656.1 hypothetical protein BJF85_08065 [Saccharomonospora sp. CUA-673]